MKTARFFLVAADMIKAMAIASWFSAALALPLPLAAVAGAYVSGFLLSLFLARKSRLMIGIVSAHGGLAALFYFLFLHASAAAVDPARALFAYFYPALLGLVWLRAIWISRQRADHAFCAIRLDEGLAIILAGLLTSNLGGFATKTMAALLAPFLVFSALSLLAAQHDGSARGGLSPARRFGALISGGTVFIAAGYGLARLVPILGEPARISAKALGAVSARLLDLISRFLSWLFRSRPKGSAVYFDARDYMVQAERARDQSRPVSRIFLWAALGIAGFVVLLILADLVRRLVRWLLKRSPGRDDSAAGASVAARLVKILGDLIRSLVKTFSAIAGRVISAVKGIFSRPRLARGPALRAYAALVAAGRLAGLPRTKPETPREYAGRLEREFPESAREALSIAVEMEKEVYGGLRASGAPGSRRIRATSLAAERIRKLCRPTSRKTASDTAPHNVHRGA